MTTETHKILTKLIQANASSLASFLDNVNDKRIIELVTELKSAEDKVKETKRALNEELFKLLANNL